ncbi:hypothetical protein N7540_011214 [Penicillium herquei]|nr:hypothetical protein N7540_011214 [Penicillium herquei]
MNKKDLASNKDIDSVRAIHHSLPKRGSPLSASDAIFEHVKDLAKIRSLVRKHPFCLVDN